MNFGTIIVAIIFLFGGITVFRSYSEFAKAADEQEAAERARLEKQRKAKLQRSVRQKQKCERELEKERKDAEEAAALAAKAAAEAQARASEATAALKSKPDAMPDKPTPDRIAAIVEEGGWIQPRRGRLLCVNVLVSRGGFLLEWKVDSSVIGIPVVIGTCNDKHMFTEFAFQGRHPSYPGPGRYVLAFSVSYDGRPAREHDLSFEVFISGSLPKDDGSGDVGRAADEFVKKAVKMADAKKDIADALREQGTTDPDEIDVQVGRFEGQQHQAKAK